MNRLPVISGKELIKALQKRGFKITRQKGSHILLKHSDGRVTVVPVHKGHDIDRSLLQKILRDINISKKKFLELIK